MTDFITEEMVEKAARAAYERQYPGGLWEASCLTDDFRDNARAALTAALPLIVEECCKAVRKEAEAHLGDIREGDEEGAKMVKHAVSCLLTVEEDIRSLLPTTTKEG
jgi:hypothetical protein